jgi:hypothetical protein
LDGIFLIAIGFGGRDGVCAAGLDTVGIRIGDDGRVISGEDACTSVVELDTEEGAVSCSTCGELLNDFKNQLGANFDVNDVRGGFCSWVVDEAVGDVERAERIDDWEGEVLSPLEGDSIVFPSVWGGSSGGRSTTSCRGLSSIGVILVDIVDSRCSVRPPVIERKEDAMIVPLAEDEKECRLLLEVLVSVLREKISVSNLLASIRVGMLTAVRSSPDVVES